jgi:hypothetical protein
VRPEELGKLEKNPPHRDAIRRPSGLYYSASTTIPRAPNLKTITTNTNQEVNSVNKVMHSNGSAVRVLRDTNTKRP